VDTSADINGAALQGYSSDFIWYGHNTGRQDRTGDQKICPFWRIQRIT
jgi:hypothetical protein